MEKFLARILLFFLLFNLIPLGGINNTFAVDTDGTANLNLSINPSVDTSFIIGSNFDYNFTLTNPSDSEDDAFKNGFILSLPDGVEFVSSASLGSPNRTVTQAGITLNFFETSNFLTKGSSESYTVTLKSVNSTVLLQNHDIKILAYANDNIYGRGAVPIGAPVGTLPGGVDLANSVNDPTDLTFPDNIDSNTDLATLPFISATTKFIPFDVEKIGDSLCLIGYICNNTITIKGNNLGALSGFEISDLIPNNRKFVGFTNTGASQLASIGTISETANIDGTYSLDFSSINIPINENLIIEYQTLALAFPISSYTGSTILLNTGSVILDNTDSINTATQIQTGTWNDGTSNISVDSTTLVPARNHNQILAYSTLGKTVSSSSAVIGDIITYTLSLNVAKNVSFGTGGVGTQITDILPDGLSFISAVSSTNSGVGNALSFTSTGVSVDGDTTIIWSLDSGEIKAGDSLIITYTALVDGLFEGAGSTQYKNTQSLVNNAVFVGTITDSTNNEEWGYTDISIIATTVTDSASASITAPIPTNEKKLISVEFPDATIYNAGNPLPANTAIPVGSKLTFGLTMDFPNVISTGSIIKDALPLLMGPNDSVYNIAFQTDNTLRDINNNLVAINDDNADGTADTFFNTLTLGGTNPGDSSWVNTSPANNIEFSLGNGNSAKTFSILFTVDILPAKPSGYNNEGFLPEKNVMIASFNDDAGITNNLDVFEVPFDIALPAVEVVKTMSGTNIEAGSLVDYSIEIKNTGKSDAFLENIIDTLPDNLTLQNYTVTGSGFVSSNDSMTQSGNILSMEFNTGTTLGRSVLAANNSVVIGYTVLAGTGLVIDNNTKINTITFDYYSTNDAVSNGVNNFGPLSSEASFITKQPLITRTLISTSETGSTLNDLEIGEEAIFETIITLPGGVYNSLYFVDQIDNNYLDYLTGSVIASSGSLVIDNPNGIFSIVNSELKLDFGNVINNDSNNLTNETIVIHTTERSKNVQNINRVTRSIFNTNSYNIYSSNVYVDVLEPNIVLNKSLNTTTGDAGDTLDYSVSLNNTGNANAYDLVLNDTLDSRFTFVTGSLVLNGFSGTETDFLSSTGLILDQLNIGTSTGITFQVIVNDNVAPADIIPNRVDITYDSLIADNSVNEKDYATNSSVNFTVTNIGIVHNLISTNQVDTATGKFNISLYDLLIGEEATYKTTITVPESTYSGMEVTQSLPVGFKFLTGSIDVSTLNHSLSGIVINPDNTITYTLGDIVNPGTNGNQTLDLYSTLVATSGSLVAGQEKGLSTLEATWDTGHSYSKTINLDIVEPNLVITKDYSISTGDGGDIATTTITITNNGTAIAYELAWTDIQPSSDITTSGAFVSSSGSTQLAIGNTITYSYTTTLNNTVTSGQILTGTASVDYTSAPGINSYERSYTSTDIDTIQVVTSGGLIATLDTVQNVKIGDLSSYTIKVPVAEGTTNSIDIEDLLPSGIAVNTGSIVVTLDSDITLTGSYQPTFTSTGMVWNFTDIVNSNADNLAVEEIVINFDTVLLNTSDNNIGDTKTHNVKAFYNGGNEKNASTNSIIVIEPNISLDITNFYNQATKQVKYIFTLTNTGTSIGYDLDLSTILESGVSYTGTFNITNVGGSVNLTKSGNTFSLDSLSVNTGNPFTFEIYADVDDTYNLGDTLTLTGNLLYTSQSGIYSPVLSLNIDNVERNGNGGINDYFDTDNTLFVYQDAILNEKITVVDDNGGSHLGGETYTYTVTLTNSGNVDLTNIPVLINIPEYLSGSTFSLQSVPGGSTNSYTSTGGAYNNGELTLSGINITVGNSVTIIYKIDTLVGTPDGTNIDTVANVGNTPEGAIGGNPNIDFTVIAPKLETTSVEVDDNGGSLYQNEYITHISTIKNIGSSTGTNLEVELLYNTGTVTYISGSLSFDSDNSLINTGSIIIDEIAGIISFTFTSIYPDFKEDIQFKSKATGDVGDKVKTTIDGVIDEGFDSNTISNELIIVAPIISSGGGGGGGGSKDYCPNGDYTSSKYDKQCGEEDNIPKDDDKETEDKKEKEVEVEKKKIDIPNKDKIKEYVEKIEEKKKLLEGLNKNLEGASLLKALPKVLPKTGTPIYDRISTNLNPKVSTSLPNEEIFRLAGSNNSNLDYWKQVLPEQDRDASKYIVLPKNGLVIPVNEVAEKTSDFDEMINGREINVNKYLKNGVVEYPGTSTRGYGEIGNKVIFGHSSYWNKDEGRYKTHFQKIIELDKGEEVWVYEKQSNGDFKRFKYIVTESYDTPKTDVEVLNPGIGKNLTLFTCTPIGGISGRWIIKAKYIDEIITDLQKEVYFTDVSLKYKKIVNNIMTKIIGVADLQKKEEFLYSIYNKVDDILEKYSDNEKIVRIFELLKYKLSVEILKL